MDKLVDHVFVLDGMGGLRDFPGNYTQYRTAADAEDRTATAKRAAQAKADAAAAKAEGTTAQQPRGDYSQRLSYNEKREYEGLEDVIAGLEDRKTALETALSDPELGHEDMTRLATELGEVTADIEAKTERWIELDERA